MSAPTRILITGGAGFIGSHLVASLRKHRLGAAIWIVDNLHHQVHGNNASVPAPASPADVVFAKVDITDSASLRHIIKEARPHIVYHLAAETGTGQSHEEVVRYCQVNVIGTACLIETLRRESPATRRIVLTASRAVYGEGGYRDATGREFVGFPRATAAMSQGDFAVAVAAEACHPIHPVPSHAGLPPMPASVYASTKLMQEYLLCQTGNGADCRTIILRLQNVYGPGQSLRNPYTGVLSIFTQQLLSGRRLDLFEDGLITRDFVFVEDVASALVAAGDRDLPHGTTIDIGSGRAVTILDTARMLIGILGCRADSWSVTGRFRSGDVRHACADIGMAHKLLGWAPQVPLDKGLRLFTDWARQEFIRSGSDLGAALQPTP